MSDTLVVFGSITILVCLSLYIGFYFRAQNRQTVFEAIGPLLGIAAFPGLIGLAYIGLHVFAGPKEGQ